MRILAVIAIFFTSWVTVAEPVLSQQVNQQQQSTRITNLWPSMPFFNGGDLGQYVQTMTQNRDQVRQKFFSELLAGLSQLSGAGADVEKILQPLAKILLAFDAVHDAHKAIDQVGIDFSLEQQFKSSLDQLYRKNDIGREARQLQISEAYLQTDLKQLNTESNPTGFREIYNKIDIIGYGTFSSLGQGDFQVTYHLKNIHTGDTQNFISRGNLIAAIDDLARQIFDVYQKNTYPDWLPSAAHLEWLPMPPALAEAGDGLVTFQQAQGYCTSQGYRLPYSSELLAASAGGSYKPGGISALEDQVSYPVLDRRQFNGNYTFTRGLETATGGDLQPELSTPKTVKFWCVTGPISESIQVMNLLWQLHRDYQYKNKEVFTAIETLRFELGDSDTEIGYFGHNFERVQRLRGVPEALSVLQAHGIVITMPAAKQ